MLKLIDLSREIKNGTSLTDDAKAAGLTLLLDRAKPEELRSLLSPEQIAEYGKRTLIQTNRGLAELQQVGWAISLNDLWQLDPNIPEE